MKRLLYILFGVLLGAAGAAYLLNKRIQVLEARWDAHEAQQREITERYRAKNEQRRQEEKDYIASLPRDKKMDYEMREALHRSQYPDLFKDDKDKEDDDAEHSD
jgi:hypothetical protein